MDTTQTEATTEFVSGEEGQNDVIDQVVNETDNEAMQTEEAVEQVMDWESEAKKFQSMYDRAYADNGKLKQLEPLGQLLESRPDLVDLFKATSVENKQSKRNLNQHCQKRILTLGKPTTSRVHNHMNFVSNKNWS